MAVRFEPVSSRRIGQITGVVDPQRFPLLTVTDMWGVIGVDLGVSVEHDGRLYIFFGDGAVADFDRQRNNTDLVAWSTDWEVLERGGHRASIGSWQFFLPNLEQGADPAKGQPDWRFCGKCNSLFWAPRGSTAGSRCAYDGGEHAANGLIFVLPNNMQGADGTAGQLGWRFCGKCHGLCWSPNGEVPVGSCPAGDRHAPAGWIFAPPNNVQGADASTGQGRWAFCGGCEGMFFDGYAAKGVCPGPLDLFGQPVPNGGGIRLEAVRAGEFFAPLTGTDPVGMTTDLETPSGAFSHDQRVYVFVNISHPRWSKQERRGDPAFGTYLISSGTPDTSDAFLTEFQFSPRIGACPHPASGELIGHDPRGVMFVLALDDHGTWRFCSSCAGMFREGDGDGRCFGTNGPHTVAGSRFTLPVGVVPDDQNQGSWRQCATCRTAYFDGDQVHKGICPSGGVHTPTEPVLTLAHKSFRESAAEGPSQARWRFCAKCAGLFWEDIFRTARGFCPAGGGHDPWGLEFLLAFDRAEQEHRQTAWRFCGKCNCLFFEPEPGTCPQDHKPHVAGAGPQASGFNFALTHDVAPDAYHQSNWRFCGKCSGLFWAGAGGHCPQDHGTHRAGAGPDAPGYDFVLPHNPGEDPAHQENWRFCQRCFALVFAGQLDRFAGANPYVVTAAQHPGVPPGQGGRTAVILGYGYDNPAGYRLAVLPLPERGTPRLTDTRYWTGPAADGSPLWSPRIDEARNLFDQSHPGVPTGQDRPTYTSINLTWLREPGVWAMLYSLATDEMGLAQRELPIMGRFAETPWDLATATPVTIFDPAGAYGVYMNAATDFDQFDVPPGGDEHKGWAYGASLLGRFTRWHPQTRELDLVYMLSLSSPYQVQLMKTTLRMV